MDAKAARRATSSNAKAARRATSSGSGKTRPLPQTATRGRTAARHAFASSHRSPSLRRRAARPAVAPRPHARRVRRSLPAPMCAVGVGSCPTRPGRRRAPRRPASMDVRANATASVLGASGSKAPAAPPPCLRGRTGSCKAASGQSACWLQTLVLRTGAQVAQARVSCGRPTTIFIPGPQKRLSAGQRRAPHTSWPPGPFDHRDKEPCRGGEAAPKGDAPLHSVEGVAHVVTWAGGGAEMGRAGGCLDKAAVEADAVGHRAVRGWGRSGAGNRRQERQER
jgi:hypothetical protein